jgi:hypothetical protein
VSPVAKEVENIAEIREDVQRPKTGLKREQNRTSTPPLARVTGNQTIFAWFSGIDGSEAVVAAAVVFAVEAGVPRATAADLH